MSSVHVRCSDDKSPQREAKSDFFTFSSISLADVTSTLWTPSGVLSETGPATSVTSCPRLAASAAIANPILPVEGFDRNLTGSRYSRVGPAVTMIFMSAFDRRRLLSTAVDNRPYPLTRETSQ